ncbi:SsrA-binding protein SmpB [Candidatus Omnitrophota bacterium]
MENKAVATNRKAYYNYTILESLEAGIELKGPEVKSIRQGNTNLGDSYARLEGKELYLYNMHISPYEFGNINNPDPLRPRKLLLHRREIKSLSHEVATKRLVLIPLRLYMKRGLVKVELALAKGKKLYDKRRSVKEKESRREMQRATRIRKKYG